MKQFGLKTVLALITISTLLSFSACSRKNKGWTNRTYHNINAHFNAFFNGNESLKEGEFTLSQTIKDNYLKVLPVFPEALKENAITSSPQMDRAIEKAAKVVKKHSIYIKGVEYCKWIDDSYLMMGKAMFLKQEYDQAKRTFTYLLNTYKKSDLQEEASIWLARTCVKLNELNRAETIFDNLRVKIRSNAKKSTQLYFNMAYADYLIGTEQFQAAIDPVQTALTLSPKRQDKTRLTFILGQLYQINGPLNSAFEQYATVIKRNPIYEMAFNARISMAKCFEAGSSSAKKTLVIKELKKLLDDDKNKEYFDQIYYTLADISLKDEKEEEAVTFLQLSVNTSLTNNYQKSVSSLKLADIYFAKLQYSSAQMYYDTAMSVLPKDYPNYEGIKSKTQILSNLVQNLVVAETQDSLQKLAKMSDSERNRVIDKVIADYNEKEQKRLKEEAERALTLQTLTQNNNITDSQGSWYFYNPTTLTFGAAEFKKKWGTRKLEDNWRRSNKEMVMESTVSIDSSEYSDSDSTFASTSSAPADPRNRATYLKDIPTTPEQVRKSNEKIAVALFNLGNIYQEGLNDVPKSNDAFEQLYTRFPEHKKIVSSLYHLYQNYTSINNTVKADFYKQIIISKYPTTDYAEILKDPNYYKKIKERQNEGETFYAETYNDFAAKQYQTVITKTNIARPKYSANKQLMARFDYINAISIGKIYGNDSLKSQLTLIISKYPETKIKDLAQTMLNGLNRPATSGKDSTSTGTTEAEIALQYNETDFHFYVLVADIRKVNFNDLKNRFSDNNKNFFSTLELQTSAIYIDDKNQMITVGKFENKLRAMDFYNFVKANKTIFQGIAIGDITQYVISDRNYPIFYKNKAIRDLYPPFFQINYIDKK